jgi:hypothetical protein
MVSEQLYVRLLQLRTASCVAIDPARAVVTPPYLPAKTNGFYALMRWTLRAVWRGPRADRRDLRRIV